MFHKYKLLTTAEYVADICGAIELATERIYIATTTLIADDDLSRGIIDALKAASERGVAVHVAADAFTYTELRNFNLGNHFKSKRASDARKLSSSMRNAGIKVKWMGQYNVIALLGRTHSKWCVIDSTVYSFGGINLDKRSFTNLDYMLLTTDAKLADRIVDEHTRMVKADKSYATYRSYSYATGKDSVLVDGGFIGDSIIYRRACQLAEEATKITLVSQYCPTGKLSRILREKRNESTLYFNHWSQAEGPNKILIRFGMHRSNHTTKYQRVPYLHAKFIIFEMEKGKKIALTGSHNFVYGGVLAGTREMALLTENKHVIRQLESFLKKHVG